MHPEKVIARLRLVAALLLFALPVACQPVRDPAAPTVEPGWVGEEVSVTRLTGKTVVEIAGTQGIGRATVRLADGAGPGTGLEFRLHLAGLERFSLTYDGIETGVSVVQSGPGVIGWVRQPGAAEQRITPDSPFWMGVTPPVETLEPVFVVQAPPDLLARQPVTVELAWVDFFR